MSQYIVGGLGWWVDHDSRGDTPMFFPPGTFIDDSTPEWAPLAKLGPPMDACPTTWATYWYMTSQMGVVGLGYDYTQVSTRFLPPGGPFILDQSQLGGPDVLG